MSPLVVLAIVIVCIGVTAFVTFQAGARRLAEMKGEWSARLAAATQDNQWLRQEAARQQEALGSTRALLESTEQRLRDSFQAVAAEALRDNRGAFLDLAKTSFEHYQAPIAATLAKVDSRLGEVERERVAAYSKLTEQIAALGSTTSTLSRALRTPSARGRWGEMQLRRVIELAGMLERCDFDEQRGVATETGRLRPDVVVHLPGGKRIVVDAKAPLEAFLDAQDATEDASRLERLKAHARQVRDHIDKLGHKSYWDAVEGSPELVVLFLPGETLFSAALQHDLTMIEYGLERRVLLASPITLIALLTTVAHAWRQEAMAENAREVARIGRELYDRVSLFAGRYDELRRKLDGAVQAYNEAAGTLEARVLVSARRLKDLQITTAPDIAPSESIERVPRVLRQAGLMGVPDEATVEPEIT